ncbi:hypothetical protein [Paraburkholderia sp. BL10I2N1]|uniref:hypothetical protein n=1 Tax=Paraburkholderia sp. BL10I2N1 TaxID=1938796 RepID=UPI0010EC51A2|nr:hypothetical protein [Paraburkholderia sp. BL10I2N1]TDN63810.1 hypothetical protein B0G77_7494 [Paraburkholderia sp. BL10I2N1]
MKSEIYLRTRAESERFQLLTGVEQAGAACIPDERTTGMTAFAKSALAARHRVTRLVSAIVAGAFLLGGCATASSVVATDKPDVFKVTANARGGHLAWARAHEAALAQADAWCAQRGMRSSVKLETTSGVRMLDEHDSELAFECHPK